MKYKEFKVSLSEQSAPNTVSIMVYFDDNTTKVIDDIPLSVFNSPEFRTVLQGKITRKYNKRINNQQKNTYFHKRIRNNSS